MVDAVGNEAKVLRIDTVTLASLLSSSLLIITSSLQELVRLGLLSPCQGWSPQMVDSCHHLPGHHLLPVALPGHPQHRPQEEGQDPLHQGGEAVLCCHEGG